MITRHSSRRGSLATLLPELLEDATRYDRIAGYFNSSVLEIAGESLERMPAGSKARIIANSDLDLLDVTSAQQAARAITQSWRAGQPEDVTPATQARLRRLSKFLSEGRIEVRVLPDEVFGLVHGKAGVVYRRDGSKVAFMGSTNESKRAWTLNYEIVWVDESPEGIGWVPPRPRPCG